ncbi:hypothetical protein V6N13_088000 [Hibiscus sabdariffa]
MNRVIRSSTPRSLYNVPAIQNDMELTLTEFSIRKKDILDYSLQGLYSRVLVIEKHHPALLIEFTAFKRIKMSTGPGLESLVDQTISVITNDGRNIVGVLKGFDQATNIILDESHERVYSTKEGVQQLVLGLYIIRGDNISVVGELDEELDSALDLSNLRAHPLKPVIH